MHKTLSRKHHARSDDFDLYGDLAKIKAALADATRDVKGKAGQLLSQSFEDAREKSEEIQDNVSTYITERPFKAIGAAMLIGIAIGYLLHK